MDTPKASRREFCAHAISLVTIASLVEGCGSSGSSGGSPTAPGGGGGANTLPTINVAAASGGTITVPIGAGSPLATTGGTALVQAGTSGSFLVTRTSQDSCTALTAICTHEQCVITGISSSTFVCPCHGSQFNTNGGVQNGPATRALRQFSTQFTNNVLTISI